MTTKNLTHRVATRRAETTNTYLVECEFVAPVLGGNPKNPEVFRTHIESKLRREATSATKKGLTPPSEDRIQELVERRMIEMFGDDVDTTIESQQEKTATGFKANEFGPYIETRQIKAMLRDCMTSLGITVEKRGSKSTLRFLTTVLSCDEKGTPYGGERSQQVNFYRDGDIVAEEDDHLELCAHTTGPAGARSFIKNQDYVKDARIYFLIRVPANMPKTRSTAILRDKEIVTILGHVQCLGANTSQVYGAFNVVNLERLTNVPWVQGGQPLDLDDSADAEESEAAEPDDGHPSLEYTANGQNIVSEGIRYSVD